MTGKDLILYILNNNLENEVVLKDGMFIGFMDEREAATKFNVGVGTICTWYALGLIDGVQFGDTIYFLKEVQDPRRRSDNS